MVEKGGEKGKDQSNRDAYSRISRLKVSDHSEKILDDEQLKISSLDKKQHSTKEKKKKEERKGKRNAKF